MIKDQFEQNINEYPEKVVHGIDLNLKFPMVWQTESGGLDFHDKEQAVSFALAILNESVKASFIDTFNASILYFNVTGVWYE